MDKDDVKHLKQLEQENTGLKKLLAERGLPQRRACGLMQVARSSPRYVPTMPIKNVPVVSAMQRLSNQYPERTLHPFLLAPAEFKAGEKSSEIIVRGGLRFRRNLMQYFEYF